MAGNARLARRQPVVDGRVERDPVPLARQRRAGARLLRLEPAASGVGARAARASPARRRSSRAPTGAPTRRSAARRRLRADAIQLAVVHHTAGSNNYTTAQSAAIVRGDRDLPRARATAGTTSATTSSSTSTARSSRAATAGSTRTVDRRARAGVQHRLGRGRGDRRLRLDRRSRRRRGPPLVRLLAWRLDLAHVDPLSKVVRISGGNPRYSSGTAVTLRRDLGPPRHGYPTSCPGASLYAQLPSLRTEVSETGLPKLYAPAVVGTLGGPVRFTARLSHAVAWTVTVRDARARPSRAGPARGTKVDWTWDATAAIGGTTRGRSPLRRCARRRARSAARRCRSRCRS